MKFLVAKRFWFRIFSLGLLIILMACGSTRNAGTIKNFGELSNLVNSREFEIESEWVNPLGGSRIYVTPGSNFIRFEGEEVEIFLPYFGVRHSGGYGRDAGINYEGPAEEFKINEDQENNRISMYFRGNHEGEDLQFYITLFPNGKADISVNSSQRNAISYQGDIMALPEDEE